MSDWNGIVGSTPATSFVSTSFVDGDDDPANLTRMHLADISNINGIVESSFISRYNLDGAGFDVTNAGVGTDLTNYAVDDIWFGSWDDNLDRHFWRKIVLPDNTLGKEQVPVLILISNDGSVNNIAVIEEDALVWREMKDSGNAITNPTILTNMEFVEHTFKPLKKVVAEFNSFRIKVELHTTNPCYLPAIRELRVLALT
jgi:hypothetical protein